MPAALNDLHAPLLPLLEHILTSADLPCGGTLLDLGCGAGEKLGLIARHCRPARVLALDRDRAALQRFAAGQQPTAGDAGVRPASRLLLNAPCARPLAGDAQALPLRAACCDAACCIAALGLFADQHMALRELRRVLRPGGAALVVTATQRWAELTRWPDDLAAQMLAALHPQRAADLWQPGASEDVAGELVSALRRAGFARVRARAFLLDGGAPLQAELALLPWAALRPPLQRTLDPAALARCEALAATAEIELCEIVLAGRTQNQDGQRPQANP